MHPDPPTTSVASLDPETRALVELSLARGLSDGDLAQVLGVSPRRVRERREAALEQLGVSSRGEREALAAQLRGEPRAAEQASTEEPPARAETPPPPAEAPPATEPAPAASEQRSSRRAGLMLALLGGLGVAALVALVLAGTDNGDSSAPPAVGPASDPGGGRSQGGGPGGSGPAGEPVVLASPAGGEGSGSAQVVQRAGERRLLLSVRGLATPAEGGYAIWLYNSVSDTRLLGGSPDGRFRVEVTLPEGADRYSFLDVSRELPDGNRTHGGASVLRARLADLLGG